MLVGITVLTFAVSHFVPSDPVATGLGERAASDPEIVAAFRARWGLDDPLPTQYLRYLSGLVHGDLGVSITSHRAVMDDLRQYLPATVELATTAMLISVVVGIPLGVLAAVRREGLLDRTIRVISLAGASVPVFWLALLAMLLFYARLGWAPAPGRLDAALTP